MRGFVGVFVLAGLARAHMSPFLDAMYGGPLQYPNLQDPVAPLGPGLAFDDWWFRGPGVRNSPPEDGQVAILPAGGEITLELACAPEYTTYKGGDPSSDLACDGPGPFHADPSAQTVDPSLLSGCAIGIADVMDPNDATIDDFVIFSVQAECIKSRNTTFEVPAKMPACTGEYCICGWVWSPQTGTGNGYHTPFRCTVTGSPADAQPIAPPSDPVYCPNSRDDCTKGAKRLISTYNEPINVPFTSNDDRPGYHDSFGFFDGPQDDIFLSSDQSSSTTSPTRSHTSATSTTTSSMASAASGDPSSSSLPSRAVPSDTVRLPLPVSVSLALSIAAPSQAPNKTPQLARLSGFHLLPSPTTGTTTAQQQGAVQRHAMSQREQESPVRTSRRGKTRQTHTHRAAGHHHRHRKSH